MLRLLSVGHSGLLVRPHSPIISYLEALTIEINVDVCPLPSSAAYVQARTLEVNRASEEGILRRLHSDVGGTIQSLD